VLGMGGIVRSEPLQVNKNVLFKERQIGG
jgi:hypothetical protein